MLIASCSALSAVILVMVIGQAYTMYCPSPKRKFTIDKAVTERDSFIVKKKKNQHYLSHLYLSLISV